MIFWIFLGIAAFFTLYIIIPFFQSDFRGKKLPFAEEEKKQNLLFKKEELLASLNDLDYDFRMHKIGETDYHQLKEKLTREAIEVLRHLDEMEGRKIHATSSHKGPGQVHSSS